jgi:hypothetical protein
VTRRIAERLLFGIAVVAAVSSAAYASSQLTAISVDPFTNTTSQHRTEVEPDVLSVGSMEVAAFQTGRFYDGGSSDIGWATSSDGGRTWKHGFLPSITKIQDPRAPYDRVSDPSVAYDAKHARWLIASLPLIDISGPIGQVPVVSASSDGLHWSNPVLVAPNNGDYIDKSWIVCDNGAHSPYRGHCYVEFDDVYQGDLVMMSTSADGGATWSAPFVVNVYGYGGQPLVLPNGTAIVSYLNDNGTISAFSSGNGGATWGADVAVAAVNTHGNSGGLRTEPLPSAQIDGAGRIYVTWQDCSFRVGCASNDIVMSTSTDGKHWTPEARIPIDPTSSTVDHFIPGIAADLTTGGSSAHLGLTYYYFPNTNCSFATCRLSVGFVGSQDGGRTWTAPAALTGPMNLAWLPSTSLGYMVGDYIASAFSGGLVHGIFAVALPAHGSRFQEHMATNASGLTALAGMFRYTSAGERPLRGAHSDHPLEHLPPWGAFGE